MLKRGKKQIKQQSKSKACADIGEECLVSGGLADAPPQVLLLLLLLLLQLPVLNMTSLAAAVAVLEGLSIDLSIYVADLVMTFAS
jgi:hypothetical protein